MTFPSALSRAAARTVITGVGCVSPFGAGASQIWEAAVAGRRCVRRLAAGDLHGLWPAQEPLPDWVGAPVPTLTEQSPHIANSTPLTDPLLLYLQHAVTDALAMADLQRPNRTGLPAPDSANLDPHRIGCVIGTSKGGLVSFAHGYRQAFPPHNGPFTALSQGETDWQQCFPHYASQFVARMTDAAGPCLTAVAACATGLVSVLRGADLIRDGHCDVVIAGAADASLHPAVLAAFTRMGVLATRYKTPAAACRPFNRDRNGFAVGEGAAVFVLEREEFARVRGVQSLARIASGCVLSETSGLTSLDPNAETLERLIDETLRRADLSPPEIGHLNLHGTGTIANDLVEAKAIRRLFGSQADRIPAYAAKGAIGHLLGAAGAVELAISVLAIANSSLPPTVNLENLDAEFALGLSSQPVSLSRDTALKLSLGFGGTMAGLCLCRD